MSTAVSATTGDIMESVLIKGDLAKLTPQERSSYYLKVCESAGLNPLTQPFAYITLNNKLQLYALRACTDQLRTIHKVSVEELAESERDGVFIVTAKVKNAEGRTDMAKGAVNIGGLKGDTLANAMMKAETKAKRRATLSLCGLGFLDETEIETIPPQARKPAISNGSPIQPQQSLPPHDPETGEIREPCALPVPRSSDNKNNWIQFGQDYIAAIRSCKTLDEAHDWLVANQAALDEMRQVAPKAYKSVETASNKAQTALATDSDLGLSDGEILVA